MPRAAKHIPEPQPFPTVGSVWRPYPYNTDRRVQVQEIDPLRKKIGIRNVYKARDSWCIQMSSHRVWRDFGKFDGSSRQSHYAYVEG